MRRYIPLVAAIAILCLSAGCGSGGGALGKPAVDFEAEGLDQRPTGCPITRTGSCS